MEENKKGSIDESFERILTEKLKPLEDKLNLLSEELKYLGKTHFTMAEVSEKTGIAISTLYLYEKQGRLKTSGNEKKKLISREEFIIFSKKNKCNG